MKNPDYGIRRQEPSAPGRRPVRPEPWMAEMAAAKE